MFTRLSVVAGTFASNGKAFYIRAQLAIALLHLQGGSLEHMAGTGTAFGLSKEVNCVHYFAML